MALKTAGKPKADDLEREVREEKKAMHREAKAGKPDDGRPSTETQRKRLRRTMIGAMMGGQISSKHAMGRAGKRENALAARRRKNATARKTRRTNRG
jgi:hypothetical protein